MSEPELCYDFTPRAVFGAHPGNDVIVEGRLHVEIRKRVLGVFHRTYGKSAKPRHYVLPWKDGHLITPELHATVDPELHVTVDLDGTELTIDEALRRLGEIRRSSDIGP